MGEPDPNPLGPFQDFSEIPIPELEVEKAEETLLQALIDNGNFLGISSMLLTFDSTSRPDIVEALTRVALRYGYDKQLLEWTFQEAVETTERKETAFRENSVFSVILVEYHRLKSQAFINQLFESTLKRVQADQEYLDMRRTSIVDEKSREQYNSPEEMERVRKNGKKLRASASEFMRTLRNQRGLVAEHVGPAHYVASQTITDMFGDDVELLDNTFTGLFYLRFLSNGLVIPKQWGIQLTQPRDPRVQKLSRTKSQSRADEQLKVTMLNLSQLSKLVTKIGLQEEYEEWEPLFPCTDMVGMMTDTVQKIQKTMQNTAPVWPSPKPWDDVGAREASKKDIQLLLEYFSKSAEGRSMLFNQKLIAIVYKRDDRGIKYAPKDMMLTYQSIMSLFMEKHVLRAWLEQGRKGKKRSRLWSKTSGKMRKIQTVNPIEKENYESKDEHFKYDPVATLDHLREDKKFVILVFYRGKWCPYCQEYMKEWNELGQRVADAGGLVIGVSAQGMDRSQRTQAEWGLRYPLIGDPENQLAYLYGAFVQKGKFINNAKYPYGMAHAAIVALNEDDIRFFFWRSVPTKTNLQGAKERMDVNWAFRSIMRENHSLLRSDSDYSLDTSMDSFDTTEDEASSEYSEEERDSCLADLTSEELAKFLRRRPDLGLKAVPELAKDKQYRDAFHSARKAHRNQKK